MSALPEGLFGFLTELKGNNDRAWFQAHKRRYEEQVKGPLLAFIGGFDEHLRRLSPHFVADPRPVGGSLFRIYRDVRFSKDKSPYKTAAGIHFRHERARDVHAPGYYLHLEPEACFAACGLWMPATAQAQQVRAAMDGDQAGWLAARQAAQDAGFALGGTSLKRPPRGYAADHPLIDDLKRKDFTVSVSLDRESVTAALFPTRLEELWSHTTPLMRFLTEAVVLPF